MSSKILIGITIVGFGLWSFFQKLAVQKLNPIQIHITCFLIGIIFYLPIYLLLFPTKASQPLNYDGIMWAIAANICATVAGLSFLFSLQKGDVGSLSVLSSASPIITVLLAMIFFNESLSIAKVAGMSLVIVGVALLSH